MYQDFCSQLGIVSWPTTLILKGDKVVERFKGNKDINFLAEAVEKILDAEKPGSRPQTIQLPAPGKNHSPDHPEILPATPKPTGTETAKKTVAAEPKTATSVPATTKALAKATETSTKAVEVEKPTSTLNPAGYLVPVPSPSVVGKPAKSTVTPNINGTSVPLTSMDFQNRVTLTQDPWFIKFYAPWCHHCQAMAPNWVQLAKEMKGRLNIGEVNCEAEPRLCKDARLRGYPTILFFRGGERVEYEGLRGLGDFVHYAEKAIDLGAGVQDVNATTFKALEEKEDVIFLYFYDVATTSEDFMAIERLPLSLVGRAKLVKTQDPALFERFKITTWPRLLVCREGRPTYYNPLTPREMRDTRLLLNWMKSVWLPIIPELTASNAREIMDGKLVVLGILNRQDEDGFLSAKREMKSAANEWMDKQIQLFQLERQELRNAKSLRIEEAEDKGDQRALRAAKNIRINMDRADRKEVTFAWVDGAFWQRWIRTTYGIDIKDGERVIVNDEDVSSAASPPTRMTTNRRQNRRYWDQTSTGNPIVPSRTSILETINKITASPPKIKPKLTISSFEKIFFDIRVTFTEHPYLSMGCILGIAFGCASWFRGRLLRRSRGGHFRLGEDMGKGGAPLLGAPSGNGAKTD